MAGRIRGFDWSATVLGAPQQWPSALRTSVRMALTTRHPVLVLWGPQLICLYNDAFSASLGAEKHPGSLGASGREAFAETWPIIGAELESVLNGGPATWHENRLVPIERHGRLEDVYWTYSHAGIEDDTAPQGTGGVLVLCTETTAQMRAAERAHNELQRLSRLFEQAPIFIAGLTGSQHRFEFVNPSYRRLAGNRELLGRTVAEAFPEVVSQGHVDSLDGVFRTGSPYTAQGAKIDLLSEKNGQYEERRIDFVYEPTRDESGSVNGIFVVGVDVTERQSVEQALAVSEEQLRLALDAGDVGLWDVDPVANTLFWPPSVRGMFGVFSDRPVTMHEDFYLGLHPDDRERTAQAYAKAYDPEARAVYDVEYRTVGRDDGLIRWVAAKGRGIFNDAGKCIRVIGTAIDITARKRDQARLEELNDTLERRLSEYLAERKLLADIVQASDTLILVLALDFKVLAINRACVDDFERLYGVQPKVGESLLDILNDHPAQRELVRAAWQQGFDSEGFVAVQEFGDGASRKRAYEMHFRPLCDDHNKRIGAYQFVYDVTERIEAEARLARTEAALLQAKKMEAVGLLTGGIAHDFNNLLQAVSTTFELIRRKPSAPDKVVEWASTGVDVAKRGARLTAQLLTFSRHQEPDIRPLRLKVLLANLEDLLRTTVGPTVRVSVACDELAVHADATQLEMALLNLAINARDAMPAGGEFIVRCRVATQVAAELPPDEYVELQVADTGCGMPAEVAMKAFEPFFTTKEIGKGSGLGLSQVYGMARRAGGTARIDSDGTSGTTVVIVLRRATIAQESADGVLTPGDRSTPDGSSRVLVIDDDPHVRKSVIDSVRELGHEVVEAADGNVGLRMLRQHAIDVVMVDFAMPLMNGATFAQLARAERPAVPVIFMSGYSDADAIRSAVGQSASLLRKPFSLETLRRAIAIATATAKATR